MSDSFTTILTALFLIDEASYVNVKSRPTLLCLVSLFQAFRWWGVGNQSPLVFFPLLFLFAYDLTCSPLSKRLEQAIV